MPRRFKSARTDALLRLLPDLDDAQSVDDLLRRTQFGLLDAFEGAFVRIWLRKGGSDAFEPAVSTGFPTSVPASPPFGVFSGTGSIERAAATGDPEVLSDCMLAGLGGDECDAAWARSQRVEALVILPLRARGHTVGVIELGSRRQLEPEQTRALALLASGIGLALQNVQLADEVERRKAEREQLIQVASALAEAWEPQQVLDTVVEYSLRASGSSLAVLWMIDVARRELVLAGVRGLPAESWQHFARLPMVRESFQGRAALSGEIQIIEDSRVGCPEEDVVCASLRSAGMRSFLMVPLQAHSRVVGVLSLGGEEPRHYDASSLPFARLLGDLSAMAIEAANLQSRLRESNAQLVAASIEAQQRAADLEEEKEERELSISLVAHELRNPLTTLGISIQALERAGAFERREAVLRTMAGQSRRLKRLVDDLLDLTTISGGRFVLDLAHSDLVALARETLEELRPTTTLHTLQLDAPSPVVEGNWDRQRIAQVLHNLITNAIKYSPEGGTIRVSIQPEGDRVCVAVRDPGVGLAAEEIGRLFLPYARLDRTRRVSGTGLGLYITRGIVEAHGGTIQVTSDGPGRGSEFAFVLPRRTVVPPGDMSGDMPRDHLDDQAAS